MSERTRGLWQKLMAGAPPVDESVPITSSDINEQTRANMAGDRGDSTGGVWTMTDAEFKFSLARAWDEGSRAGLGWDENRGLDFSTPNPYEAA